MEFLVVILAILMTAAPRDTTAFKCPYSTFKYDFNNQAGFTTTLETPVGDQPGDDALRGSGDSVPMTPADELVIECDKNSKAFTVMELEFNVEPDGGQPTTVTVVFTLEDGREVIVVKTVPGVGGDAIINPGNDLPPDCLPGVVEISIIVSDNADVSDVWLHACKKCK